MWAAAEGLEKQKKINEKLEKQIEILRDEVKGLQIENKTLLDQLNGWQSNVGKIMDSNTIILNKIIPLDKKLAEEYKKHKGESNDIKGETDSKRIDATGNILLPGGGEVVDNNEKKGIHTLSDL